MNNKNEMNQSIQKAALIILVIAFAVICLGTVAIPLVLTVVYSWKYLLIYPVALIIFLIYATVATKRE